MASDGEANLSAASRDGLELTREVDGHPRRLVGLNLGLVLFVPLPFSAIRDGARRLLERYLELVPLDSFSWQNLSGTARGYKPLAKSARATINGWLDGSRKYGRECSIWLSDGDDVTDAGEHLFELFGRDGQESEGDSNLVRMYFPHDTLTGGDPSAFVEGVHHVVDPLPFHSGYFGYTLNTSTLEPVEPYGSWIDEKLYAVARRYLGVEVFQPHLENYEMKTALRSPAWLTFLSSAFVDELGGVDSIRGTLGDELVVRELEHGWSFQCGERPVLADQNRKEDVAPEQRELARLMSGFFSEKPAYLFSERDHSDTVQWLRRFTES